MPFVSVPKCRYSQPASVQKMAPSVRTRPQTPFARAHLPCSYSRHRRSPPHAVMYALHLQHPAVTLQTSCLHGLVTKPSSPSLRLSPTPPLPTSSRSRFSYAVRASAAESPRPDPPQVTDQSDCAASTPPGPSASC
jgi:hypothetical protein